MNRRFLSFCGAALLLAASSAQAVLVSRDSEFGATSLIWDEDTGLQWLRLDLTFNTAYADVTAQLGAGGRFEGFSVARASDVTSLMRNQGAVWWEMAPYTPMPTEAERAVALNFVSLFDATGSRVGLAGNVAEAMYGCGPQSACHGLVPRYVSVTGHDNGQLTYHDDSYTFRTQYAIPGHGTFLVTAPVPEPETYALMAVGLFATIAHVKRRRKASADA